MDLTMEENYIGGGGATDIPGRRPDGTPKGRGFFGELKRPDGQVSTELSVSVDLDGKKVLIPLLVPTLDKSEVDHLLSGKKWTQGILDKAVNFATSRMGDGRSPFADAGDGPANMDPVFMEKMKAQMRGSLQPSGALPITPMRRMTPGGTPDNAMPARQMLNDDGMGMSMGDPNRAITPTRIPNAYRGSMTGMGALNDVPRPGSGKWEI